MQEERPKYFLLITILVVFLLTLGILVYYIRFRTSITPRASTSYTLNTISISNSYMFASPVRAKAGGDLIRVTIFLLDENGMGISDRRVELRSIDAELNIKGVQSLTDDTGKAIFDVGSDVVGAFNLEALTDEFVLLQKVKVIYD